ncbi:MAG: NAD(P)H-dependent oxidoreductase [Chloroflexi bacterium]|nr:NAD(P)H-dependent oxidoreductase [Chloroflexota bacterium]
MLKDEIKLKVPEKVKILGINGSPRKANTYEMVKFTLEAAESMGYVETELINLGDYYFGHCTDCKKCIGYNKPAGDPPICYDDPSDQQKVIRDKEEEADAVLLGWPVYGWHQPALVRMSHEHTYVGGSPFFNEVDPTHSAKLRRFRPRAYIAQGGQTYAGQEDSYVFEAAGLPAGFTTAAWPTAEDPEPQASYMGGMLTCADGMSVYRRDAWTTQGSRINPPLTGERNERTLRNLGKWLAVSAMMFKIGRLALEAAEIDIPVDQGFVRYAAGKPKPGSVLDKLIKEGKVTYIPQEELESRKRVKA